MPKGKQSAPQYDVPSRKFGYTTCPECGKQSVKGTNATHPWCVQIAELKRRVEALEGKATD